MKKVKKTIYEVFNSDQGIWEEKTIDMTEYNNLEKAASKSVDVLDAEYQIVTKIISQQMGLVKNNLESMD
tara:strand:+ start:1489 stop:1698 length:210 start_codon:yes stop_codon:yes gene_type:complete